MKSHSSTVDMLKKLSAVAAEEHVGNAIVTLRNKIELMTIEAKNTEDQSERDEILREIYVDINSLNILRANYEALDDLYNQNNPNGPMEREVYHSFEELEIGRPPAIQVESRVPGIELEERKEELPTFTNRRPSR